MLLFNFNQCVVLENIHTLPTEGNKNSEGKGWGGGGGGGRGLKKGIFQRGRV